MGEMRLMGAAGDTKVIWNPDNQDEVDNARQTWDRLVTTKRFLGFRMSIAGDKGEQIKDFDPDAARLIVTPPMAGGAA